MRMRQWQVAVTVGCTLVLGACAGADDPDAGGSPDRPEGAVEASFVSLDELADAVVSAITDASERFGVRVSDVAVAGALRVVWSDGSLGCPEEGMMYTQALVDGYLLTLEVDGRRVAYHGQDGQPPFICER
jgi:hypothetical protein